VFWRYPLLHHRRPPAWSVGPLYRCYSDVRAFWHPVEFQTDTGDLRKHGTTPRSGATVVGNGQRLIVFFDERPVASHSLFGEEVLPQAH
jgi:hypothetical protein